MAKCAIDLFKEAAAQMQKEAEYLALKGTTEKNDADETLQTLIGDFNLARIDLNSELSKSAEEKDKDRVAMLNTRVNDLYQAIMENESMKAYNEAKQEMEAVVAWVNAIITTAVNGGDPMTVEQPTGGCSGSCASCGGCH